MEIHAGMLNFVDEYLSGSDWRVKENSNMNYSLQGLNFHLASSVIARYWLARVYSRRVARAHREGDLHIHDLGILGTYCVGWDLYDLLLRGFGGVQGKIESRPPKHFRTALGQIVNFFYTLQGESAGAQAFSNFDTLLAPFIRYDGLSYEEVKQALQEFIFNVNVPTRVGFQSPFTNLTMDLQAPDILKDQAVVIGGELKEETYADFQEEMDMINQAFCELMMEGDAKGRIFTFPIPTYNITPDFDWDNEKLEPLWEMTRKYGIPYFANFVNSDMDPSDARSMCPLHGEEMVLIRSSRGRGLEFSKIRSIAEGNSSMDVYEVYSAGKFVKGRFNKFPNQRMLRLKLVNGHEIVMSDEHLNYVRRGPKSEIEVLKVSELREGYYLPYSLVSYDGTGGNRDLGFLVGVFAGDGSSSDENSVIFSLNSETKKDVADRIISIVQRYFGANVSLYSKGKLLSVRVNSKAVCGLCRDFVKGSGSDKHYTAKLFGMSKEFREGVLEGHIATDAGSRNRIYTASEKMVQTLNMLAATLGTITSVIVDDRTSGRYGKNSVYGVIVHRNDKIKYGDRWFKDEDKIWVRIESIEEAGVSNGYCFEIIGDEPMFTVGTTGILTHNCRLRLDNRELRKRLGGLFGSAPLTGSIGVVTLNMPRLGYLSKDESEFFERLETLLNIAKESLETKRVLIEELTENGLYPYSKRYLNVVKERTGKYWSNHFSTIGLIGMNEACLNLFGESIATERGRDFAIRVLEFMRDKISKFQEETGNYYNLEATPGEGTSYRLARIDRAKYPDIIAAGTEEVPYYTNSVHLPVGYSNDIFEILTHQDDLQVLFTGGTVVHLFIGEEIPNTEMVKKLVRAIVSNFRLPYFSITPTFSVCPVHGYIPGKHDVCPFPHTEEDLKTYGEVLDIDRDVLKNLEEGSVRILK